MDNVPSVTTWSRLEPEPAPEQVALAEGYAARIADPLWLLARQGQLGEFQGEDGGTPIVARWRGRVAQMTRYESGPIPPETQLEAGLYDPDIPLETQVERQPLRRPTIDPALAGFRLAVESGQHFLRLLRLQATTKDHSELLRKAFAVPALTPEQRASLDPDTLAYVDLVAGRALDGRRLRTALGDSGDPHLDKSLGIAAGDVAEVERACRQWLAWSESLFSEPGPERPCWQHDRFEYAFSLSTRLGEDVFGERTLTAQQYDDGTLDWYSFDLNGDINMGTGDDPPGQIVTRTVIPAPVTFHGMPAPRFWEFEDAQIDLGAWQPGATDLAQLLLIDTLTGFGNDWFVIPVELSVGSLVESQSLAVTDTFGVRTLLRPPRPGSGSGWSMFSLAMRTSPGDAIGAPIANLFFLPPTLVRPLEGPVLEEIMIVRDELANLAWAIERRLESPIEEGLDTAPDTAVFTSAAPIPEDTPLYRLASPVPSHWIPLLPVQVSEGSAEVRLARGAALDLAGRPRRVEAQARLLGVGGLLIPEEEAPREGLIVRRTYQAARWHDGRLFIWAGNRVMIGRGEGSSGLAFDALEG